MLEIIQFVLIISPGVWWAFLPESAQKFYTKLYNNQSRNYTIKQIRTAGIVWMVLVGIIFGMKWYMMYNNGEFIEIGML